MKSEYLWERPRLLKMPWLLPGSTGDLESEELASQLTQCHARSQRMGGDKSCLANAPARKVLLPERRNSSAGQRNEQKSSSWRRCSTSSGVARRSRAMVMARWVWSNGRSTEQLSSQSGDELSVSRPQAKLAHVSLACLFSINATTPHERVQAAAGAT